jgi:hypothetical protein
MGSCARTRSTPKGRLFGSCVCRDALQVRHNQHRGNVVYSVLSCFEGAPYVAHMLLPLLSHDLQIGSTCS